ncbi:hypothetical protein ILUMI_10857 [Ignelater luminosus]|uniref:CLIP domain-containing serine protease n=1 Tax=Ignelater luminosus TaxID=2038154 RepID=A0A8K0GD85_IGNLU|nr:hypothetical protein ILUMI_10857 [Ignelater luminosus]
MKSFLLWFSCCIISVFSAQYQQSSDFESCSTVDLKLGQCVTIKNCPSALSILEHRPLSAQDLDYLSKVNCGYQGRDPKVCCALSETDGGGSVTTVTEIVTKHPPVSGDLHSNLLPSLNECGTLSSDRIVGGKEADLDEFPWMALVEYQKTNGRGFYCGGVLISKRYVLTAAHCVKGKDLPRDWRVVSVRLGEHDLSSEVDCAKGSDGDEYCSDKPVNVPVTETIAHESYDPLSIDQHHDIALLRLIRNVDLTDWIKPICVPTTAALLNDKYSGVNMTVAGWGKTESRSESNVKLKLNLQVKDNTHCQSVYRGRVNFGLGQLCAGGELGKDSCRGDSGGPLMAIDTKLTGVYYVYGIVSFGPNPCGLEGWPGVYTRVTEYVPWIISKLKP